MTKKEVEKNGRAPQYEVEIMSAHNLLIHNQRGAAILVSIKRGKQVLGTLGIGPATLTWRAFNSSKDVTLSWEKVAGLFSALQ